MPQVPQSTDQQVPVEEVPKNTPHKISWLHILIGVVLGAILIGSGFGVYLLIQSKSESTDEPTKVSTPSAKQAMPSATATPSTQKDETADWKTFVNDKVGYSVKYPRNWLINSYKDGSCATNSDADHTFFAPSKDLLGICSSGYVGLVNITRVEKGYTIDQYIPKEDDSNFKDLKIEEIKASKRTVKYSGISTVQNEAVDWRGNKIIVYLFDLGDRTLIITYNQDNKGQDFSEIFEKMFSTFKFLD